VKKLFSLICITVLICTAVLTDSFSGLSITRGYTLTATADCYYRVEVTFNGIVGDHVEYSYCFVNPIFVNLS